MANEEQLAILKQGADVWNRWRKRNFIVIDLSGANLSGDYLFEVNLEGADLRDVNLNATYLGGADLSNANLSRASLSEANLMEADLINTLFSESSFGLTVFGYNDISTCIGLETTKHDFPSIIGTDTIHKSKGKIPLEFLRGCGLSDLDIAYAKLAAPGLDAEQVSQIIYDIHNIYLDQPIQFYSVFISYSSKDDAFAKRLHDDLQDSGVRCWFAPEDLKIGDRIRLTIDHQIRMREKLIVIVSENSLKSEWVGNEVEAALVQERVSGKDVLFPIRLDDAVLNSRDDWAAKIKRRRNIGDFSNWKDDTEYQKMFQRLLRDLRASEE